MTSPQLLVNENFPVPAVRCLRLSGDDVVSIAEAYSGISDAEVLALAAREGRWLVTFDRDYGELIFARRHKPPPTLILLRAPSYRPEEPADWVIELATRRDELQGRFVVYDGIAIRSRPFVLPVGAAGNSGEQDP